MTNNATRTPDVHAALDALRKIKAPTKRAAFVAATLVALRTQDEVIDFVRQIRLNERVQDVALLPDTLWTIERSGSQVVERTVQTSELLTILAESECPIIDFPNILFHYGFIVTFTRDFEHFIARSADYGITETYMSS
jgi:hypothetical protein